MANAIKAAASPGGIFTSTSMYVKAALFHSSPFLDRKRRTSWDSGGGPFRETKRNHNNSRRFRKMHAKHTLLRNVSAYAEQLFKSWKEADYDDPSSSNDSSWFRRQYRSNTRKCTSQGPCWETYNRGTHFFPEKSSHAYASPPEIGGFNFCNSDDEDVEAIFRSALGGARFTYWSFPNEEEPFQWSSWKYSNQRKSSRNKRNKREYDYDTYEEYDDDANTGSASDRMALGLSASGPLKLEDVKSAYRSCALKWHPDRHQGSSKAVAEEKFKLCSAAYQTLCDKLE